MDRAYRTLSRPPVFFTTKNLHWHGVPVRRLGILFPMVGGKPINHIPGTCMRPGSILRSFDLSFESRHRRGKKIVVSSQHCCRRLNLAIGFHLPRYSRRRCLEFQLAKIHTYTHAQLLPTTTGLWAIRSSTLPSVLCIYLEHSTARKKSTAREGRPTRNRGASQHGYVRTADVNPT